MFHLRMIIRIGIFNAVYLIVNFPYFAILWCLFIQCRLIKRVFHCRRKVIVPMPINTTIYDYFHASIEIISEVKAIYRYDRMKAMYGKQLS